MTVMSAGSSKLFHGGGSAGPFTWTWRFLSNSDIRVTKIVNDVGTLLVEGEDYTLTGARSYWGGSLMLMDILAEPEDLFVQRFTETLQQTSIRNQGNNFRPAVHEDIFDNQVMMVQDLFREVGRAIKMPITAEGDFYVPIGDRTNTLFGFDGEGNPELKTASYSITAQQVIGVTVIIDADASVGPVTVNLPASGEVLVTKTDDTANIVTLATLDGKTIQRGAGYELSGQDEFVRLIEMGGNWRRS